MNTTEMLLIREISKLKDKIDLLEKENIELKELLSEGTRLWKNV